MAMLLVIMAPQSWHKGSNVPSIMSVVVNEKRPRLGWTTGWDSVLWVSFVM